MPGNLVTPAAADDRGQEDALEFVVRQPPQLEPSSRQQQANQPGGSVWATPQRVDQERQVCVAPRDRPVQVEDRHHVAHGAEAAAKVKCRLQKKLMMNTAPVVTV